jgi:hypothetical protein
LLMITMMIEVMNFELAEGMFENKFFNKNYVNFHQTANKIRQNLLLEVKTMLKIV